MTPSGPELRNVTRVVIGVGLVLLVGVIVLLLVAG